MRLMLRDRRWNEGEPPEDLWSRMNEAWRDLVTLVRQIDAAQTIRVFDFTGPLATVTLDVAGNTRPVGVTLVSLYETSTNATSAVTFSWTWSGGAITTTSFSALPAGSWRATFHIIGGA